MDVRRLMGDVGCVGLILGWTSIDRNWQYSRRDSTLTVSLPRRETRRAVGAYGVPVCDRVDGVVEHDYDERRSTSGPLDIYIKTESQSG